MNLARQHRQYKLLRLTFNAWHALIENKWRDRVENACKAKAQEVCLNLTEKYEAELAKVEVIMLLITWLYFVN